MTQIDTCKAAEGLRRQIEAVRAAGHDIDMCAFIRRLLDDNALGWHWDSWDGASVQAWRVSKPVSRSALVRTSSDTQAAIMELVLAGEVAFAVDTVRLNIVLAMANKGQRTQ